MEKKSKKFSAFELNDDELDKVSGGASSDTESRGRNLYDLTSTERQWLDDYYFYIDELEVPENKSNRDVLDEIRAAIYGIRVKFEIRGKNLDDYI